jgi:hypothetical protein
MKQNNELTPTIAEMTEVVATYMGEIVGKNNKDLLTFKYKGKWYNYLEDLCYLQSWDWLHEVWEKVREESTLRMTIKDSKIIFNVLKSRVQLHILKGTPIETLTALYNAIIFINKLKQK